MWLAAAVAPSSRALRPRLGEQPRDAATAMHRIDAEQTQRRPRARPRRHAGHRIVRGAVRGVQRAGAEDPAGLDESLPELGDHLDRSIRTGAFCGYFPDGPRRR